MTTREQDTATEGAPKGAAWDKHRADVERVRAALDSVEPAAALEAVLAWLDRKRLDAEGNPTDPPGLYMAAATAVITLVDGTPPSNARLGIGDEPRNDDAAAMVERIAAAARGRPLQGESSKSLARELAELVDAFDATASMPPEDKAPTLARTLAKRHGRAVDAGRIAQALASSDRLDRITAVGFAAGVFGAGEDFNDARERVRKAVGAHKHKSR